jgi:serine/threonine protein kinase
MGSTTTTFTQIRGIFETCDHFVLELELLEGVDLFRHVSSKNGFMEEDEAAQIMRDIFTSLDLMARNGIAHRDIKPANILISHQGTSGGEGSVKVADFGMAGFTGVDGHLRGRCGTPGYVAPEVWTTSVHGGYGNKVDVYSAGVTLYVLLCGYEPFYGESDAELIAANKAAIIDYPEEDWSRSKYSMAIGDLCMYL